VKPTCDSSNGVCGAGWNETISRVIEPRNVYSRGQEDNGSSVREPPKPTLWIKRKAAVLGAWASSSGECPGHHRGL